MIFEIIQIVFGIIFVLFLPGFLLSLVILKDMENIERIALAIGLSISIVVALGFSLTFIGNFINIRLITSYYVWISLALLSLIFGMLIIFRHRNKLLRRIKWTQSN